MACGFLQKESGESEDRAERGIADKVVKLSLAACEEVVWRCGVYQSGTQQKRESMLL